MTRSATGERIYGTEPSETSLPLRFKGIIRRAHEQTGHRVAILVDEYDKPMLQAIGNEELQKVVPQHLAGFLFRDQNDGREHQIRFLNGRHQVR